MKIKPNSDDDLSLKKILELHNIAIIVFRSVFHDGNKYHPNIFIDDCLFKLSSSGVTTNSGLERAGSNRDLFCIFSTDVL